MQRQYANKSPASACSVFSICFRHMLAAQANFHPERYCKFCRPVGRFPEDVTKRDITEALDFIPTFITPKSAAFNAQMFYSIFWCHPVDKTLSK